MTAGLGGQDLIVAEAKARQRRQQAARLRGLEGRAAAMPLLADHIRELELTERADYFAARQAKAAGDPWYAQIDNHVQTTWELSGIAHSYAAIAYRAYARQVFAPLHFLHCDVRASRFAAYGPHYRADIWHCALRDAGYQRQAEAIHAAHTDDPAKALAQFAHLRDVAARRAALAPEQLALAL